MGFFIMIFSAIIGIALISIGAVGIKNAKAGIVSQNGKKKTFNVIAIVAGVVLVLIAVYLGLPK